MAKEVCSCGKMAVWLYAPGFSSDSNPFFCDDCISSKDDKGCSCNHNYAFGEVAELPEGVEGKDWKWVNQERGIWQGLDERGRPFPCVEYDWDDEGFDVPTFWSDLKLTLWFKCYYLKQRIKSWFK